MRAVFFLFFSILSFFAAGQSDDRVKLRDLQAATGDGQVIQSINDTSRWVVPPWADSISVLQDSIVVLYSDGSEVARDTVGPFGGATTIYYQTLRDDSTPLTQRDAINFVATSTVATTLTDDAGNGETEVAMSVPTGGITTTQILDGTIALGDLAFTPVTGSGTSGTLPKWTGTTTLGNSLMSDDGTLTTAGGTAGIRAPNGTTAQRPGVPVAGTIRYNTTTGALEYYAASAWEVPALGASTTGLFTSTRIPYANSSGRLTENAALWYNSTTYTLTAGFNSAGSPSATGTDNNVFGRDAAQALTTGNNNNFMGRDAGRATNTGQANNFYGNQAGRLNQGGGNNNFFGDQSGYSNLSGQYNNYFGYTAGYTGSTVSYVNAFGSGAGYTNNATGQNFFGYRAGYLTSSGTFNNMIGYEAGYNNAGGYFNNYIGFSAGRAATTGFGNIMIGASAGDNTGAGADKNVLIGYDIDLPTSTGDNQMVISNLLFGTGASGTGTSIPAGGKVGIKVAAPARDLHVAGEARIADLNTDTPTRIVGADADGDLNEITLSSELLLSGGVLSVGTLSHAALSDLGSPEDDHDQYLNIFGRAGGQIVYGATGASENLDLNSTTNATKGNILLQDEGGNVIIGGAATASRLRMMEASGSGTNYTEFVTQAQAANVTYTLPADDGDAGEQLQTNGSGSLSWQPPGGDIDFEVYDVAGSYTYNIPTGAKAIDIITIGGGGGGGSGRKGATTDANTGGGGGGGGGYSRVLFVVSQLSASSLDIDVGAGGTGGASVSTSSTNGSGGADGEITTVYCSGFLLCAGGPGDGGGGGSTGASTGGVDATIGDVLGQNGGSCATDGVAAAGDASNNKAPGGGGSGGGIPAGGTPAKNGSRSAKYNYGQDQITNNGTVASPDAGDATANAQQITGGGGGAGGASSIASSGGDGGDGIMGSGGGGGGAALNGVGDSGAGGAGGTGWVLLIVKY